MAQKRLLILSGTEYQATAIRAARRQGHYVITCDYLPNNPAHRLADEYHNVSTTDEPGVLALAERLRVDGILAYASDPAAPTAAHVAARLGLPGNPYDSVRILTSKDLFRRFLQEHGFHAPRFRDAATLEQAMEAFAALRPPLLIKPVDSSGSKGVLVLHKPDELPAAFQRAIVFSRSKRVILEEFVTAARYQIAGDGFVVKGRLVFRCFANEHFPPGRVTPIGESFPSVESPAIQQAVHEEVQRLLTLLGMKSGELNFDIRVDAAGRVWLMEIAARAGGQFVPDLVHLATGVDLSTQAVNSALGDDDDSLSMQPVRQLISSYAVHSLRHGTFKGVELSDSVRPLVMETRLLVPLGTAVHPFEGSHGVLAVSFLRHESMDGMLKLMDEIDRHIRAIVD